MKTPSTFSILFWINLSRAKNNQVPFYARITVNGKRANISLNRKIPLSDWDSNKGKLHGNNHEARKFNRYLDQTKNDIFEAYEALVNKKVFLNALAVKSRFLGEDKQEYTLLFLIDYHNTQMKTSLTYGTLKNYFTTQKYIKLFLLKLKIQDMNLSQLTFKFLIDSKSSNLMHRIDDAINCF